MDWFRVDKDGLSQVVERQGKAFALLELLQNAWDESPRTVRASLTPVKGRRDDYWLAVEDDAADGFRNLTHAFTLFADSTKKRNPTLRGRFNIGEKLFLALCAEAEIISTEGGFRFDSSGRHAIRNGRSSGSIVRGRLRLSKAEYASICEAAGRVIPPCQTFFNGQEVAAPQKVATTTATLATETCDESGALRKSKRQTTINVYEHGPSQTPYLYELGIPVQELEGDRWSYDVQQKVPLSIDRQSVTPAFLRDVRLAVVNALPAYLTAEDAASSWVRTAAECPGCQPEATEAILTLRFGSKRVAYDPSDPEASKRAVSQGYTVVPGRALSADEWANARRSQTLPPAGQVCPTPKPFTPDGAPLRLIEEFSHDEKVAIESLKSQANALLGRPIEIRCTDEAGWGFAAAFGPDHVLTLNLGRLGYAWLFAAMHERWQLLLHELAHGEVGDHLSSQFAYRIAELGAALAELVLTNPTLFQV